MTDSFKDFIFFISFLIFGFTPFIIILGLFIKKIREKLWGISRFKLVILGIVVLLVSGFICGLTAPNKQNESSGKIEAKVVKDGIEIKKEIPVEQKQEEPALKTKDLDFSSFKIKRIPYDYPSEKGLTRDQQELMAFFYMTILENKLNEKGFDYSVNPTVKFLKINKKEISVEFTVTDPNTGQVFSQVENFKQK